MKAISVKQPWASLIAEGRKTIEVRTWKTNYRGPLLIVSSKSPKVPPVGQALAVVQLVDCRRMTGKDEEAAMCDRQSYAFSWVLSDLKLINPFHVDGKVGFYEVDDKLIRYKRKAR